MNDKVGQNIARAIGGLALLFFLLFGLVIQQPCDLDNQYLWCRLHPFSIADWIGTILVIGGGLFMLNVFPENWRFWESPGTSYNVWLGLIPVILGFILVWNL